MEAERGQRFDNIGLGEALELRRDGRIVCGAFVLCAEPGRHRTQCGGVRGRHRHGACGMRLMTRQRAGMPAVLVIHVVGRIRARAHRALAAEAFDRDQRAAVVVKQRDIAFELGGAAASDGREHVEACARSLLDTQTVDPDRHIEAG